MENSQFVQDLTQRVETYQTWLDRTEIPRLHELLLTHQTAVRAVYTLFLKKGLIKEDPYKYENKISEVEAPDGSPYPESERNDIIGLRLVSYEVMLDFLNNSYQFSSDFLTLDRVKRISDLLKTFNWRDLSPNSPEPNTHGLAALAGSIKNGADQFSADILSENINRISKDLPGIIEALRAITAFHRENYKLGLRRDVLPNTDAAGALESGNRTQALRLVKHAVQAAKNKTPFYSELVEEIFDEDYAGDAQSRRESTLAKITPPTAKTAVKKNAAADMKLLLMDAVRVLGSISPQLDEIVKKLEENRALYDSQHNGFWDKLKKIFRKAFNVAEKPFIMNFDIVDPATHRPESYSINYAEFLDDVKRRSSLYTNFAVKTSPTYKKLEQAAEAQTVKILGQNIDEMQEIIKKLQGLDGFFKNNVGESAREKVRGIKVEISTLKNTLIKTNQKKAEYLSAKEEEQQLAKLGVKIN